LIPTLQTREKKFLSATLTVVVVAIVYQFFLDPFFQEWRGLAGEIHLAKARLQKTERLLKKQEKIESAFLKYGSFSSKEKPETLITGVLQELEELAQTKKLKILDMRPLPLRQKEFFQEQNLEVSAEGTAPQFAQFIYGLLDSPNALKIERLELSSKAGDDQLLRALIIVSAVTRL